MDASDYNEYRGMNLLSLRHLLEYSTQFQERRKIRAAIREAKSAPVNSGNCASHGAAPTPAAVGSFHTRPGENGEIKFHRAKLTVLRRSATGGETSVTSSTQANGSYGLPRPCPPYPAALGKKLFRAVRVHIGENDTAGDSQQRGHCGVSNRYIKPDVNGQTSEAHVSCRNAEEKCEDSVTRTNCFAVPLREAAAPSSRDKALQTTSHANGHLYHARVADVKLSSGATYDNTKSFQDLVSSNSIPSSQSAIPGKVMAAPNLSTAPGLSSYNTGPGLPNHFSLVPASTSQSDSRSGSDLSMSSTPMMADTNSIQFLHEIRERLGRRGSHSDVLTSPSKAEEPSAFMFSTGAGGAAVPDHHHLSVSSTTGQTTNENPARRHVSTSVVPDLSKLDIPGKSGGAVSTRARSNFLANFYSQKEAARQKENVGEKTSTVGGTGINFGDVGRTNKNSTRSTPLTDSRSSTETAEPPHSSTKSLSVSSIEAERRKLNETMHALQSSRETLQRNVLTPRGLSHSSTLGKSEFDTLEGELQNRRNLSSNPEVGLTGERKSTSPQPNKQVRFSDEHMLHQLSFQPVAVSREQNHGNSLYASGNSSSTPGATPTMEKTQSRLSPRLGISSKMVSPTSTPGVMRSEGTQTTKSTLAKNSPNSRSISITPPHSTSSSYTNVSTNPGNAPVINQTHYSPNLSPRTPPPPASISDAGRKDLWSPPGFPRTFPGPRRHSSFDAFSFSNFSPGSTSPLSAETFTFPKSDVENLERTGNANRPDEPSISRSGTKPSEAGNDLRQTNLAPKDSPEKRLPRPRSPQAIQMSSMKRPSSPGAISSLLASQSRRSSLPDPSALTKQQVMEALRNASHIKNKYTSGLSGPVERHPGQGQRSQNARRLLSDDAAAPSSNGGKSPTAPAVGQTNKQSPVTLQEDYRRPTPGVSSSSHQSPSYGSPAVTVSQGRADTLHPAASTHATDARKSRDIGLRGKLGTMPSSSLLPSKQTYSTDSLSLTAPSLTASETKGNSYSSEQRRPQDIHTPAMDKYGSTTTKSTSVAKNEAPPSMTSMGANYSPFSAASSSPSSSMSNTNRGRSSPAIADIRGFIPITDPQQQPRRRSLRSDGVDGGGWADQSSPALVAGREKENESFRLGGSATSAFLPTSAQTKSVVADTGEPYVHIDRCESELELAEMLTTSEDFNERRRIRARMRELKMQQQRRGSNSGSPTKRLQATHPIGQREGRDEVDGGGRDGALTGRGFNVDSVGEPTAATYNGVTSLPELQKLLAETSSAEERHKIRNVIRQLRHSDIEQLKLSKPRPASDPWRDTSTQPQFHLTTDAPLRNSNSSNGGSSTRDSNDSSSSSPTAPKSIDLSKFLSQNSASINSNNGKDIIDQNIVSEVRRAEPPFTSSSAIDQGYERGKTTKADFEYRNKEHSQQSRVSLTQGRNVVNVRTVFDKPSTSGSVTTDDEHSDNDVFISVGNSSRNKKKNYENPSSRLQPDLSGDFRREYSGISKPPLDKSSNNDSVSSVLDQVKAKLRSRSEGLSALDKAKTSLNYRISGTRSPEGPSADTSAEKHKAERRGSERYRDIRDHILGGSVSLPESVLELEEQEQQPQQQQHQQRQQQEQHQQQQQQLHHHRQQQQQEQQQLYQQQQPQQQNLPSPKKRISKIPIPVWRQGKASKSPYTDRSSSADYRYDTHSSKFKVSSLAEKLSEFRHDLDKEEELFKSVTERRSSSLPNSIQNPEQTDTPYVKFVLVGTSKQHEQQPESTGGQSSYTRSDPKEFLTDLKTKPAQVSVDADQPLCIATEPTQDATVSASLTHFTDENSLHKEPRAFAQEETVSDHSGTTLENGEEVIEEIISAVDYRENKSKTFGKTQLEDRERGIFTGELVSDKPAAVQENSVPLEQSRSVHRNTTESHPYRQTDAGHLESVGENQTNVREAAPVPRKRKSGVIAPYHSLQKQEISTAESLPPDFPDAFTLNRPTTELTEVPIVEGVSLSNTSSTTHVTHSEKSAEESEDIEEADEKRDQFEIVTTRHPIEEAAEETSGTKSSDSSEFWKHLIGEPATGAESEKTVRPPRRPLRSSVPVFGNYPKSSAEGTSDGGQDSTGSASIKRRHSDVSNRPNMEQLFSSLLDDLDQASQSESNPSDAELSDGEDLLAQSSGSNTSNHNENFNKTSATLPKAVRDINKLNGNESVTESSVDKNFNSLSSSDIAKGDLITITNSNATFTPLHKPSESNGIEINRETAPKEITPTQEELASPLELSQSSAGSNVRGARNDLYSIEDSGIGLGVDDVLPGAPFKGETKTTGQKPAISQSITGAVPTTMPLTEAVAGITPKAQEYHPDIQLGRSHDNHPVQNKTIDITTNSNSPHSNDQTIDSNHNINSFNVKEQTDTVDGDKTAIPDSHSRSVDNTNAGVTSEGKDSKMAETVTSSTTLMLSPTSENIHHHNHHHPAAVSTVKTSKPNTRAVGKRTFDVNEDDDGSVTYQASSEEPGQNRTVTVRTRRLRTPSDATEELRDTIVERKYRVQRPAGKSQVSTESEATPATEGLKTEESNTVANADPFSDVVIEERDVVRTKKRLTSRGSNYYSRSTVTTRLRRDRRGTPQTVEHDVVVESGAKSVSKGQSWGDRATTHVTTMGDDEDEGLDEIVNDLHEAISSTDKKGNASIITRAEAGSTVSGISEDVANVTEENSKGKDSATVNSTGPQNSGINTPGAKDGMDLSKVSSGYGSGPGSEEEGTGKKPEPGQVAASPEETSKPVEGSWVKKMGRSFSKKRKSLSSRRSRRRSSTLGGGGGGEEGHSSLLHPRRGHARVQLRSLHFMSHGTSPPEVVQVLKDVTVCEGRQLLLECAFSSSHLDKVVWSKDDVDISNDAAETLCRYDADTGKATYTVTQATIFDTALYVCSGRNEAGEARTSCRVVVKRRPEKPPVFEAGLSDVTITEGHSTVLTCTVAESETVAWYKDGIVQRNSSDFKQTFDGRCARLEIGEVFLDDVGEYACVAKNEAGETRSSCQLSVDACGSETTVVPMFLTKMSNKVVNSGETLHLECDVIGTPEPNITWTKDGEDMSPELTFSTCYDGRLATLELSGIRVEDAGTYRCVAHNPAGRVSMDAVVTVQVKNQVPYFASSPEDVTTEVGHSITLRCEVRGVPRPLVFWRLDDQLVGDSARCIQSYSGGAARLEVLGAALSDDGLYECVARNDVGQAACSCKLTVVDPKAQRQAAPREEQIATAPPAEITVRRRTFKKLSEPRPADIISAVLQRAATSPRGVQRAQSFSPQSSSAAFSVSGSKRKGAGFKDDSVGVTVRDNHQLPELSEFSADVSGNSRIIDGEKVEQQTVETSRTISSNSSDISGSGGDGVCSDSAGENDSLSASKSGDSSGIMISPRVSALRLSEQDSSPQASKKKAKATNLGRSASMHTVRNNDFLSPRRDGLSPSSHSTIKPVWAPAAAAAHRDQAEAAVKREVISSSTAPVDKISEVTSPHDIPGYRSVSPLLSKPADGKETIKDFKSLENKAQPGNDISSSHVTAIHRAFSEPASSSSSSSSAAAAASQPSSSSSSSPSTSSQSRAGSAIATSSAATSSQIAPAQVVATQPRDTTLTDNTSTTTSSPIPSKEDSITKPQPSSPPPSSSSSSSSPPSSYRSSTQSSARDSSGDLDSPSLSDSKHQAAPQKQGKTISPRVSELRLQFLKNDEEAARGKPKVSGGAAGVRRWHSLPPQEFKPKVIKRERPPLAGSTTSTTMPASYDNITDEEELHKMMNATEDFEERKAIRARLRQIRDKQRDEMEAKRKERESRAEDHVKKKFLQAEEEKKKKMEAYKHVAPTHERESKYHAVTENMIREKQKLADEDKAAKMAAYSNTKTTVGPGGEKITTSVVTEQGVGGTVAVVKKTVEKTGPGASFGGASKPAEETARELTEQLMRASGPGVRGQITVKTESWNSSDGKVEKSEKTQTWGAKPQGAKGAMAAFKQMDNATNPAPARPNETSQDAEDDGGLLAVSLAKKAATTMRRNAVAIKQEILHFCKMNIQEYEDVEITNFSTSWNNGMAFCALIHHFFPEAFDFKSLNPKQRRKNFELAFDTAEKEADIAPLLDVEDMVRMKTPDWKCVFTYVQSIYRHLKDHERNKAASAEQ